MKIRSKLRILCLFTLVFWGALPDALAAGIDCNQTSKPSEAKICSNTQLLKLDSQLSDIYAQLNKAKGLANSNLQKTQQNWLSERDKCADEDCLTKAYTDRIAQLNSELRSLIAYKPDKTDLLALDELKQALEKRLLVDKEFPLETTLKSFEISKGVTTFSNDNEGNDSGDNSAHFPTKQPKGVSADEWKALLKSDIEGGGENGHASYTLLDINGDGKRDLIIDSYIGGTGLFDYISPVMRKGDAFEQSYISSSNFIDSNEDSYLYSLNGRGANQQATWLKLQGRVYVAYRTSNYGVDHVFLLRPFFINEKVPSLTVHYQYALSIPQKQKTDDSSTGKQTEYSLDAKTYAALAKAIKLADTSKANDSGTSETPICPIPANTSEDDKYGYFGFGPGHYSYEIVGDMPIWIDKTCFIGRLADWFGGYSKENGLYAALWMSLPNDQQETSYTVNGKRKAVKIEKGLRQVDFGGS